MFCLDVEFMGYKVKPSGGCMVLFDVADGAHSIVSHLCHPIQNSKGEERGCFSLQLCNFMPGLSCLALAFKPLCIYISCVPM